VGRSGHRADNGEVETLLGDPTKAREKLGWTPTTTLEELVAEMVAADKGDAKKRLTSNAGVPRWWAQWKTRPPIPR
jgi:hypothetical protein